MQIKKEELQFLDLFSFCADNKSKMGDKFCIDVNKNETLFLQSSKEVYLIHKYQNIKEEKSERFVFPINTFASLIKLAPEKEQITINSDSVSFSGGSEYKFDILKYNFQPLIDQLYFIEHEGAKEVKTVNLEELDKLTFIKNFMGDSGLDVVGGFENYFVASNKIRVVGAVKLNELNSSFPIFLPKMLVNIVGFLKLTKTPLYFYKNEYCFIVHNNTYIFCPLKEYKLPNILNEKQKTFYDHPLFIKIDRLQFILALQRISLFTKTNYYDRVFISVFKDGLILENKDSTYAKEILLTPINDELLYSSFIISTNHLLNTLNLLTDKFVSLHILPTKEAVTVTIKDENKFYIHMLYSQK